MNEEIDSNKTSPLGILKKINFHLGNKRKKDVKFVFFLSILSSIAESVSVAILIPFVSFFVNPDSYAFNNFFKFFFNLLNVTNSKDILTVITICFIFIVFVSSFIRLKYIKFSNMLSDRIAGDFREKIFKFLITQDYAYFFKHGSSEIMSNIAQKTGKFTTIIFSSINIINSILISVAVMSVLILKEPIYTPIIMIIVISFFFIVFKLKSKAVIGKGQVINLNQNFMIDIFQNTIGYLPEMIVYNLKSFFFKTFSKLSKEIATAAADVRTISMHPKIYLETFFIIFIIIIIYFGNFSDRSIELNVSYLAILAFGTQKCLPLINNIYNLSINFKSAIPTVNSYLKIVEEGILNEIEEHKYDTLVFEKKIKLENLSFKFDKNLPNTLNKLSFEIIKGDKVLIKGRTGTGKSTLINIIMGLLEPTEGQFFVDDTLITSENIKNWQKNIAIVPQTVFLNNSTIKENIAIYHGANSIDFEKVKHFAKLANIDKFIESLPNKYDENVGERGVRLSGGQIQRIGIARALYRNTKIIILDEPTNALDSDTENLVMNSLINLSKDITIIMISHNYNSLKFFDKIIDLKKK